MSDTTLASLSALDSEQAVIGAALYDPETCDIALERLRPDMFFEPYHAAAWERIGLSRRTGSPADALVVTQALAAHPAAEAFGPGYFTGMVDKAVLWSVTSHIDTIADRSVRRQVQTLAREVAARCNDVLDGSGDLLLAELERGAADVARASGSASLAVPAGLDAMDMLEAAWRGDNRGVPIGLECLDKVTSGIRQEDVWVIGARTSMGKAQPLGAGILLADGSWTTMGALSIGDELASIDGVQSIVRAIHPQGPKPIYSVTLSDGRSTEVCGEHLWEVKSPHWLTPRVLSTLECAEVLKTVRHGTKLSVPVVSGDFGKADHALPVDPYILGALLGDGGLKYQTQFTSADPEIIATIAERLTEDMKISPVASSRYGYSLAAAERLPNARGHLDKSSLRLGLERLGLAGLGSERKFVPDVYLRADRQTRIDVLRGLMDTDGWAEAHGSVRFSSCSHALALNVQELVRSLGGICEVVEKSTSYTHNGQRKAGKTAFICRIRHNHAEEFFGLERKRVRAVRRRLPCRLTIKSITQVRVAEAQCITVSHPRQLYVTDGYTVTHNSVFGLNLARAISAQGRGSMVFSLEMPRREVQARLICDLAFERRRAYADCPAPNVRYSDILQGRGSREQRGLATDGARALASLPMVICDAGGLTIDDIRVQALRQMRAWDRAGVARGCVLIDHIGLIRPVKKGDSKAADTADIVNELKSLAKSIRAPIIVLSQVNRGPEGRQDKRPTVADLNWSGAIEQIADMICLLYREAYYLERSADRADRDNAAFVENKLELLIQKNRSGPTCNLEAWVDVACNAVRDVEVNHTESRGHG